MRYRRGVFQPEAATMSADPLVRAAKADSIFLELVARYAKQERHVSCKTGLNYAPKKFAPDPLAKGCVTKDELEAAMNRLLENGRIVNERYGAPSDKTTRLVVAQYLESLPISPQ